MNVFLNITSKNENIITRHIANLQHLFFLFNNWSGICAAPICSNMCADDYRDDSFCCNYGDALQFLCVSLFIIITIETNTLNHK